MTNRRGSFLAINQWLEARYLFSCCGEANGFSLCGGAGLLRSIERAFARSIERSNDGQIFGPGTMPICRVR